VSSPIADGEF